MFQTALESAAGHTLPEVLGVLGQVSMNYCEVRCCDMALYYLSWQLSKAVPHPYFRSLKQSDIQYLDVWLHQAHKRNACRFDGTNEVSWEVKTLEYLPWLALALDVGINEETIRAMAIDDAHFEQDKDGAVDVDLTNDAPLEHDLYQMHYVQYCQSARYKAPLLSKIKAILNN